jgi:hypothetical protein
MIEAIRKLLFPLGVKLPQEDRDVVGGYFVWLRLPPRVKANLLTRRCNDTHNLVIADGGLFEVSSDSHLDAWGSGHASLHDTDKNAAPTAFPYDIRLCFAWEEEQALEEGIYRLAEVLRSMLDEPEGVHPHVKRKSFGKMADEKMDVSNFQ